MTLEQRIKQLEESINEVNEANNEGEEFDLSLPIDNQNEALEIIKEFKKNLNILAEGVGILVGSIEHLSIGLTKCAEEGSKTAASYLKALQETLEEENDGKQVP